MNDWENYIKATSALTHHLMLVLLVVGLPTAAAALGFGTLALSSHLNQALRADVPILLNASDDIDAVHVALASQNEYRQMGLQWQPDLAHISVILQDKHSGRPYISLRSVGAIHTAILSVLLKANKTGRGTYYKHFQLLLDPVEVVNLAKQQPVVMPLHSRPLHAAAQASPVKPDAGWARIWRYGPVRAGDSLSEIAYRLRRDKRFSNAQVMLSLYENNPHEFVEADINLLKRGAWLTVPRGDVVKQYADPASMQKLSQLLTHKDSTRQKAHRPAKQGATPASKARAKPKTKTKPKTKPKTKTKQTAPVSGSQPAQALHYSGKIGVSGITADKLADGLQTVKNGFNQQFDSIHAELMSGKLQMVDLGKTVSSLNQSVQVIQQDIHSLKKDVAIIKSRTNHPIAESFSNYQLALFALLAAIFGALITLLLRKKPVIVSSPVTTELPSPLYTDTNDETDSDDGTDADDKPDAAPIADESIQLLNRAEECLGRCNYELSAKILRQIDKLTPDSVRASALKAQLFHETDRHDERNTLINSISESSDKQRWEHFCQLLPSHVWNACFGCESNNDDATRHDGT